MPYFQDVQRALADEGKHGAKVYPPAALVYRCLRLTPLERVRVVIVGQDPYPGAGQADGLAFSVPASVPFPSGLKNIFQELTKDIPNFKVHPTNGSLTPWAMQGVLLLNATLTVRANEPGSHKDLGWSRFTDAILKAVVERDAESPAVFMLWGRHAQAKVAALDLPLRKQPRFLVLTRAHPSGLCSFGISVGQSMDACLSLLSSAVLDESRPMSVMGLARSAAVRVSVARRALTQFAVDQVARVAATVAVSVVDDTTGMLNVVLVGDSALGGLPGRIVSAQVYGVEPRIEGSSPADRDLRALTQRQASALQAAQPHDPVIQPSAAIERTASAPVPVAPPAASAPMPKRKPDEPAKPAPAPKKAKEESAAMRAFLSRESPAKEDAAPVDSTVRKLVKNTVQETYKKGKYLVVEDKTVMVETSVQVSKAGAAAAPSKPTKKVANIKPKQQSLMSFFSRQAAPPPKSAPAPASGYANVDLGSSWSQALAAEFRKPYFQNLQKSLAVEIERGATVFPPSEMVYRALQLTPLDKVRVVIVGQDPYHGPGQAEGLSFSVPKGVAIPSSLYNIFKELQSDIPGFKAPDSGNLVPWAERGVLLLNASLTVRKSEANSHKDFGWSTFTDAILKAVVTRTSKDPIVFMLWGQFAQKKVSSLGVSLNDPRFLVLKCAHPSGLSASRGFFGCRHFSRANAFLKERGADPIEWQL
ncbi:Uracil-DNA glycosylase [Plasmodiophora brassicae]|uniref:Uracil-DNA glycosylase n=1 Tax=Plasmodiophora brassicae TaxID=37360 RepID=A0A0G4IU13_PLABS|nr:hypothetical protein PBRA_006831 [Plasmodiophora brassicae]